MDETPIIIEHLKVGEIDYGLIILNFQNAIALFIYEGSPKFGTCGLSIPGNMVSPPNTLFISGLRDDIAVRMIGEKIAKMTNKLVLISINVTEMSSGLHAKLWEILERKILDLK